MVDGGNSERHDDAYTRSEIVCQCKVTASTNETHWGSGWSLQSVNERFSACWSFVCPQGRWVELEVELWLVWQRRYGMEHSFCWPCSSEESLIHAPQLSN